MATLLAKRVETLEREVAELKRVLRQFKSKTSGQASLQDWQKAFGRFKDDPTYDEAARLGREWRNRQPKC